jgi:hypothetical protein
MACIRYVVAALALAGTMAACDSDPYMARKGGYTPGSNAWSGDRSTNYASQAAYYRNYKGIHPGSQM